MESELTNPEKEILRMLEEGRCTRGYIEESTEYSSSTIGPALKALERGEYIKKVHDGTALYELVEYPPLNKDREKE